jgi:hypothetical protein
VSIIVFVAVTSSRSCTTVRRSAARSRSSATSQGSVHLIEINAQVTKLTGSVIWMTIDHRSGLTILPVSWTYMSIRAVITTSHWSKRSYSLIAVTSLAIMVHNS